MKEQTKEDFETKVKELEEKIIIITDEKTSLAESLKKALEEKGVLVIQVKDLEEANKILQTEIQNLNFDIEALSSALENFKTGNFKQETPKIELKDNALKGLIFTGSEGKKDEKTGKMVWTSFKRPLTADDILSVSKDGKVIVTKDGKKYDLTKKVKKAEAV